MAKRVEEVSGEQSADIIVLSWSQDTSDGRATVVRKVRAASTLPVLLLPVKPFERQALLGRDLWPYWPFAA